MDIARFLIKLIIQIGCNSLSLKNGFAPKLTFVNLYSEQKKQQTCYK